MKRLMLIVVAGLLLSACSMMREDGVSGAGQESSFTGIIEKIDDQIAIVRAEEGDMLNSGEIVVDLAANRAEHFQVGDKVKVTFDGEVRESHPAQIKTLLVELVE